MNQDWIILLKIDFDVKTVKFTKISSCTQNKASSSNSQVLLWSSFGFWMWYRRNWSDISLTLPKWSKVHGAVRLWGGAQRRAVLLWGGRDPAEGLCRTGLGPGADGVLHGHFPSELCRGHRRSTSTLEWAARHHARGCQTCSGNWCLCKRRAWWFLPLLMSYRFSSLPYRQLHHLCSLCRLLRLVWSGWWLSTTLPEIQTETCPFSREITFWSASILILGGAAVDSMAERAFSPGLLLRAQVWSSNQS